MYVLTFWLPHFQGSKGKFTSQYIFKNLLWTVYPNLIGRNWISTNLLWTIWCKIQIFVNWCLRYILRIWWPKIISNKDLWRTTGQEDINLEFRKWKFRWIGHTLRKEDGEVPKADLLWNPQGSRKRGRPKTSWRRSVTKEVGRSWNELRFLAADRSGKNP